jgi:hypothetical protein
MIHIKERGSVMIIFLDIDGVLNQLQPWYLDKACIKNLSDLCKKMNATIILTSSWRKGYSSLEKYQSPQVKKLISEFTSVGIRINGVTPSLENRQTEINQFIQSHNITDYIILDDDISEFDSINRPPQLYIINNKTGLTSKDVNTLIKRFKH